MKSLRLLLSVRAMRLLMSFTAASSFVRVSWVNLAILDLNSGLMIVAAQGKRLNASINAACRSAPSAIAIHEDLVSSAQRIVSGNVVLLICSHKQERKQERK